MAQTSDPLPVAIWGTSNAWGLYEYSRDAFESAFLSATGREVVFNRSAWGGKRLVRNDWDPGGDWHPISLEEMYESAQSRTQSFFAQHGPGVIVWNQGNDAVDIVEGTTTQGEYTAAQTALLDSLAVDFPGTPVYLITVVQSRDGGLPPSWEAFREAERATCEAHPNCTVAVDISDAIHAYYTACTTEECRVSWYKDDRHWGFTGKDLVMETAAAFIAADLAEPPPAPPAAVVTFQVDMAAELHAFQPGHAVGLRGAGGPLAWDASVEMADPDGDGVFAADVDLSAWPAGTELAYKFVHHPAGSPDDVAWEDSVGTGAPPHYGRLYAFGGVAEALPAVAFVPAPAPPAAPPPPAPPAAVVTFQVDMAAELHAFQPGHAVGLRGAGGPLAWDASVEMADPDGDGVFAADVDLSAWPAGTELAYKFVHHPAGSPDDVAWEDSVGTGAPPHYGRLYAFGGVAEALPAVAFVPAPAPPDAPPAAPPAAPPTPVAVTATTCADSLVVGEEGAFAAAVNEDAAGPLVLTWAWGDGTAPSAGLAAAHAYGAAGTYEATFTAEGPVNAHAVACLVTVSDAPPPAAPPPAPPPPAPSAAVVTFQVDMAAELHAFQPGHAVGLRGAGGPLAWDASVEMADPDGDGVFAADVDLSAWPAGTELAYKFVHHPAGSPDDVAWEDSVGTGAPPHYGRLYAFGGVAEALPAVAFVPAPAPPAAPPPPAPPAAVVTFQVDMAAELHAFQPGHAVGLRGAGGPLAWDASVEMADPDGDGVFAADVDLSAWPAGTELAYKFVHHPAGSPDDVAWEDSVGTGAPPHYGRLYAFGGVAEALPAVAFVPAPAPPDAPPPPAPPAAVVTFQVDMAAELHAFQPGHAVGLRGAGGPLAWDASVEMADPDGDGVFAADVDLSAWPAGTELAYKFVHHPAGSPDDVAWEDSVGTGAPPHYGRLYAFGGVAEALPAVAFVPAPAPPDAPPAAPPAAPPTPVAVTATTCADSLVVGEEGAFAAAVNEDAAGPLVLTWAWGDGTAPSAGLAAAHAYGAAGTYEATFTAEGPVNAHAAACLVTVSDAPPPAPVLDIALALVSGAPVPLDGGRVSYEVAIANPGPDAAAAEYWIEVLRPDGAVTAKGPYTANVAPGGTFRRTHALNFSAWDQSGTHTITGSVGTHDPRSVIDADALAVEKVAPPPGPPPAFDITLALVSGAPVPLGGGRVSYEVAIANPGPDAAAAEYWIEVLRPDGAVTAKGPYTANVAPGGTFRRTHALNFSAWDQSGTHTITGSVGTHDPRSVIDADALAVEKVAPPPGPPPAFDITLALVSGAPVPLGGGRVSYEVAIANPGPDAAAAEYWIEVLRPGGTVRAKGPYTANVAPGGTFRRTHALNFSAWDQSGTHTITGLVGTYDPRSVIDADALAVEKLSEEARLAAPLMVRPGGALTPGSDQAVSWPAEHFAGSTEVSVMLACQGHRRVRLARIENTGSWTWRVPAGLAPASDCQIRVAGRGGMRREAASDPLPVAAALPGRSSAPQAPLAPGWTRLTVDAAGPVAAASWLARLAPPAARIVARDAEGRLLARVSGATLDGIGSLAPGSVVEVWMSEAGPDAPAQRPSNGRAARSGVVPLPRPQHFTGAPAPDLEHEVATVLLSTALPDDTEVGAFDEGGTLVGAAVVRAGHAAINIATPAASAGPSGTPSAAGEDGNEEAVEPGGVHVTLRAWDRLTGSENAVRLTAFSRLDSAPHRAEGGGDRAEGSDDGGEAAAGDALRLDGEGVWFVTFDEPAQTAVGPEVHAQTQPTVFALEAAAPNPFTTSTSIAFAVPEASRVSLTVYDLLGREVAVLASGHHPAGRHSVTFDGRHLPSGVYLVRMTAGGGFAESQRTTLLR